MITEEARQTLEETTRKDRILWLQGAIKEAEVYERLIVNDDFLIYTEHLKKARQLCHDQIDINLKERIITDSPFKRMRLDNVITRYQLEEDAIEYQILYPIKLAQRTVVWREELSLIKIVKPKEEVNNV